MKKTACILFIIASLFNTFSTAFSTVAAEGSNYYGYTQKELAKEYERHLLGLDEQGISPGTFERQYQSSKEISPGAFERQYQSKKQQEREQQLAQTPAVITSPSGKTFEVSALAKETIDSGGIAGLQQYSPVSEDERVALEGYTKDVLDWQETEAQKQEQEQEQNQQHNTIKISIAFLAVVIIAFIVVKINNRISTTDNEFNYSDNNEENYNTEETVSKEKPMRFFKFYVYVWLPFLIVRSILWLFVGSTSTTYILEIYFLIMAVLACFGLAKKYYWGYIINNVLLLTRILLNAMALIFVLGRPSSAYLAGEGIAEIILYVPIFIYFKKSKDVFVKIDKKGKNKTDEAKTDRIVAQPEVSNPAQPINVALQDGELLHTHMCTNAQSPAPLQAVEDAHISKSIEENKPKSKKSASDICKAAMIFLYAAYLIFQCIFAVPHTVYNVTYSSQNVPHYTAAWEETAPLWASNSETGKGGKVTRTNKINYSRLFMQIIVITFAFLAVYFVLKILVFKE